MGILVNVEAQIGRTARDEVRAPPWMYGRDNMEVGPGHRELVMGCLPCTGGLHRRYTDGRIRLAYGRTNPQR